MEKKIMYLFSRTPVHVGAGNSVGAIDSPIQRERHTRIPIIPGSSLKGVLADLWNNEKNVEKNAKGDWVRKKDSTVATLFGQEKDDKRGTMDSAGALLIGEARVLAFPVRSAKGAFAWITCPLALARYKRDTGAKFELPAEEIKENECLASEGVKLGNKVVLEEYCFSSEKENKIEKIIEAFAQIGNDDVWKTSVVSRLVIVSDEIFSYFVENACEVVTRIKVDDETGTVAKGALFNQEQVPSETMFYAVIAAQDEKGKKENKMSAEKILEKLEDKIKEIKILQVGGDETIGLGYCSVNFGGN